MVSGDPRAGDRWTGFFDTSTMLLYDDCQRFHSGRVSELFSLGDGTGVYRGKAQSALQPGGLYYELKETTPTLWNATPRGATIAKVLRTAGAQRRAPPRHGSLCRDGKILPQPAEEEILASPSLMQGMSMLCALAMDYEGSERWYGELQAFAERCGRQDAAGKQAAAALHGWTFLSPAGRERSDGTIPAVFRLADE